MDTIVDLFCGAGGTSTGILRAAKRLNKKVQLYAINHWDIAIETHKANHPDGVHLCESLDNVDPRKLIHGGRVKLLVASPECTHHSIARGGRPCSDQSRASGWHIIRWAEALYIENILIENVKEFESWGPLGANGKPLKSQRGKTYQAFIHSLRSLGYRVEHRVVNCANYGDPTTRERLFIMARRGNKKIIWPEPTHTPDGSPMLFRNVKPWVAAKTIIDWSIEGKSIFGRKKPLAENTMKRILTGLRKFSSFEPFLIGQQSGAAPRSVSQPVPTIATAGAISLEPFIIPVGHSGGENRSHSIQQPLPTVTTLPTMGLVQPYIVNYNGNGTAHTIDKPLPTISCKDRFGLVMPEINGYKLDIKFRMLQPHELARAMSFPETYVFAGKRDDIVKQIGNAVPGLTAEAHGMALLS